MTVSETNMRMKRTMTIATVLVVLAVFMALGVVRSPRRAEARNIPSTAGSSPIWAEGYELPLRGDDLAVGERFFTFVHESGIQAEGKDIAARRRVAGGNWSALKTDGADKTLVQSYIDYGKPFYAMAPGTIIACWRNAPNNVPGSLDADIDKIPGGGNHLWIRQDDGVTVLYAHAQPGSIPTNLCPHNETLMSHPKELVGSSPSVRKDAAVASGVHVQTGQFLGRIGNSGQSAQSPHLHIHMEKDDKPVIMKFNHGLTTSYSGGNANYAGPWKALDGKAMPKADILFWPPRPTGTYTFNGTPGNEFQALFDHLVDSGEMPDWVSCASNGDVYNSKWIPSKGHWVMEHGMSAPEATAKNLLYTSQGYKRTSSFTCGSVSVAVWWKN